MEIRSKVKTLLSILCKFWALIIKYPKIQRVRSTVEHLLKGFPIISISDNFILFNDCNRFSAAFKCSHYYTHLTFSNCSWTIYCALFNLASVRLQRSYLSARGLLHCWHRKQQGIAPCSYLSLLTEH